MHSPETRVEPRSPAGATQDAALRGLPQPMHVLETVFGTQHYHFGLCEDDDEPLQVTQDRMSMIAVRALAANGRGDVRSVLDIGSGLGGTSQLLVRAGMQVAALEPSAAAHAFARAADGAAGVHHVNDRLERFAALGHKCYDGAVAIEVLQYFPCLDAFFAACRRLLAPGAKLVIHDVCSATDLAWDVAPFHRRGRVRDGAAQCGFEVLDHTDVTNRVAATLPQILAGVIAGRGSVAHRLAGADDQRRRQVHRDVDELLGHVTALRSAFAGGHLGYAVTLLRRQ